MPQGTEEQMSGRMDAMGSLAGPDSDDKPASQDQRGETTPADETGETTGDSDNSSTQDAGDVTSGPAGEEAGTGDASRGETAKEARRRVFGRFGRERRDVAALATQRDEMLRLAKPTMPDKEERLKWVYSELDRMYPPLSDSPDGALKNKDLRQSFRYVSESAEQPNTDSGQIQGLSKIPEDWPELPSNASLGVEVGWVQANRLSVVEERPGQATLVRLERAASPAPSLAALGWLETSIRSYAKFVDVAARASGTGDDEGAVMRRECMALEEVKALIDEMKDAGDIRCPECGAKV